MSKRDKRILLIVVVAMALILLRAFLRAQLTDTAVQQSTDAAAELAEGTETLAVAEDSTGASETKDAEEDAQASEVKDAEEDEPAVLDSQDAGDGTHASADKRGSHASQAGQDKDTAGGGAEKQPDYRFRNRKLLNQHYEKHGVEMGFASAEEYEDAAAAVIGNPESLHKTEKEDGDDVYYLEESNEFVILSKDGYIRTYFLPSQGRAYYDRQ